MHNARAAVSSVAIRVADVIDADPHGEQRIPARPRRILRLLRGGVEELVYLINEGQDGWLVGGDKAGIDRGPAVCIVEREDERLVVDGCECIEPVLAASSRIALLVVRFGTLIKRNEIRTG